MGNRDLNLETPHYEVRLQSNWDYAQYDQEVRIGLEQSTQALMVGAGDRIRTGDSLLGRQELYH